MTTEAKDMNETVLTRRQCLISALAAAVAPVGTLMAEAKGGIQSARYTTDVYPSGMAYTAYHVEFLPDQVAYRLITLRVDGKPKWKSKLTPSKGSATASPFLKLGVRT